MKKTCSTCQIDKDLVDFYLKPNGQPMGQCKACREVKRKLRYQADPDAYKSRCRSWRTVNRDRANEIARTWRAANPDKQRNYFLKATYGITLEAYESLFKSQEGKCKICGQEFPDETLVVDHDHQTGAVRGLLCNNCNTGIGYLRDSPDLLLKAIAYLKEHGK